MGQELFILPEHMSKPCTILSFCVVFCRFFFLLSFFVWSLHCLAFFDLRFLMTTLESSNVFHRLTFYDRYNELFDNDVLPYYKTIWMLYLNFVHPIILTANINTLRNETSRLMSYTNVRSRLASQFVKSVLFGLHAITENTGWTVVGHLIKQDDNVILTVYYHDKGLQN